MLFLVIIAIIAPLISTHDPSRTSTEILKAPSRDHIMGTDQLGRDIYSRILFGARTSLVVAFVSACISATIGILIGAVTGYFGGVIDEIIMRFLDIFLVIPVFFLILIVVALFGSNIYNVMTIIGLFLWPRMARLVRGQFLTVKERPFVEAEKSLGASNIRIIFRVILPNVLYVAIVNLSLQMGDAILTVASLGYLGLGDPTNINWGMMINEAQRYITRAWWMPVFPGLFITLAVLVINLIADGLNDALNPMLR
jgi:peptide/nickel transport system permease protein